MKLKIQFNIVRKLILCFFILLVAVQSTSYLTWQTLAKNMELNNKINKIYNPSVTYLNEMLFMTRDTKVLIKSWVATPKEDNTDKKRLQEIHSNDLPNLRNELAALEKNWTPKEQERYKVINNLMDSLFKEHRIIMEKLNNYDAYNDPQVIFLMVTQVEETGEVAKLADRIHKLLSQLVEKQKENVKNCSIQMDKSLARFNQLIFIMALLLSISILLIGVYITRTVTVPIHHMKDVLFSMSKGIFPEETMKDRSDEIGEMANALNLLVKGLKKISEFSLLVGEGNLNSEFKPSSEHDALGNSLITMRENLKKADTEAELRRIENNQRTWMSQGVAKFSEILRRSNDNMEDFTYLIISNLVKYLDANLGGLFVIDDSNKNDIHLDLSACFAYNRRKFIQKRIDIGVTIVGQCVLEKETIFMTEIPADYIKVTSGLGEDTPSCLLVVPLITNEEVYGVVEIAAFKVLEPYQVEFVEKIAENIASTIQSVKINNNTARLLSESQEKSERLARQEEEMRRSIEDMKAAQQEMLKNDEEKYSRIRQEYEHKIRLLQNKITDLERKNETKN